MRVLASVIVCSVLLGGVVRAQEVQAQALQSQPTAANPSGALFDRKIAIRSISPAVAKVAPGLMPLRTCNLAEINGKSIANGRLIFKTLNGKRSQELTLALRQNKAFIDFVERTCPRTAELENWVRLSKTNFNRDSKLAARYREEEREAARLASREAERAKPVAAPIPVEVTQTAPVSNQEPTAATPSYEATGPYVAPTPEPVAVVMTAPIAAPEAPILQTIAVAQLPVPESLPAPAVEPAPYEMGVIDPEITPSLPPATREFEAVKTEEISYADAPMTTGAKGWVYLGAKAGETWSGRHFQWSGDLPSTGMSLDAIGQVNIRDDYIRYARGVGLLNPAVIGSVTPGQSFTASQVVEASPGYYWAEIDLRQW